MNGSISSISKTHRRGSITLYDHSCHALLFSKIEHRINRITGLASIIPLIFIVVTTVIVTACGSGKPELEKEPHEVNSGRITVAYLKSLYKGSPCKIGDDFHIRARVISSDRCGNFYKTLVVQDETGGISLKIDLEEYFQIYYAGDELSISCNSLTLGSYGGLVQLGNESYDKIYEIGFIPSSRMPSVISKMDDSWVRPQPVVIKLDEAGKEHLNCFVAFEKVQFADEEFGLAWCEKDTDTDRHLVDMDGNRLTVRTSRYASFAYDTLPEGSGYIEGILSCFNNAYQLIVIDIYGVEMDYYRF